MPSDTPTFFPMMVNLAGRKCLVVGAGKIAAEKIAGLMGHGPEITVVSPRAVAEIRKQARARKLKWIRREFSAKDVKGVFLVIAAANSNAVNAAVFRACKKNGILCNAVDDPENCDFFYPAVVRRGALQIAISTNGLSPALASRLRKELEQQFGPEWKDWVEHLGAARRKLLAGKKPANQHREQLLEMVAPRAFRDFIRMRKSKART
jgi:siroheme synthase-like protein